MRELLKRIGITYHDCRVDGRWLFSVLTIGRVDITQYGCNGAMHGALNAFIPRVGYVCFKPPTKAHGVWWPWYFYVSPDATPQRASVRMGRRAFRGGYL